MKKEICFTLIVVFTSLYSIAVPVTGVVKNAFGEVLPFASIVVKGATIGATANNEGQYFLNLPNGGIHFNACMLAIPWQKKKLQ